MKTRCYKDFDGFHPEPMSDLVKRSNLVKSLKERVENWKAVLAYFKEKNLIKKYNWHKLLKVLPVRLDSKN